MIDHDPLCLSAEFSCEDCQTNQCLCDLIAKARADERERCAQQVGLILGPMEREARGMAGDPSTGRLWLVRADALRDAIHVAREVPHGPS